MTREALREEFARIEAELISVVRSIEALRAATDRALDALEASNFVLREQNRKAGKQ